MKHAGELVGSRWPVVLGLSLFATVLLLATVGQATDWLPINPAELQMKDLPEQPGAPAFVLFHEEIDNDPMHFHSLYMRIKVLTEAGRKYADVQIPYAEREFGVQEVHGRTIHSDGSVVEFQGKPLDKVVVKGKNLKVKVKAFSLPDVQVGSIIEYRYTLRYDDVSYWAARWYVQEELFQQKAHFQFIATTRDLIQAHGSVGNGLAYNSLLPKGASVKNTKNEYDLGLQNVPAFVEEEHMPPPQQFKYYVRFYYRSVSSADDFWKEEGKYWSSEIERFLGKKKGISDAVAGIVAANDTPEQKVKKIYAYVATIDNLSFKPERTEQEKKALHTKENRGVEDILRQKSGDRNEITLLFVAMVRAAGIPANVMWVSDRSEDVFLKDYLTLAQLDDLVAFVQLDGKEVFLDPGTKFCPYGILYWKNSGTEGLKQVAGGAELARTPVPTYMQALTKRVARLSLNDQGEIEGSVGVGYFGQEGLIRRIEGSRTDDEGRTKLLEDEVKSWLPSNAQVTLTKQPKWTEVETPFVAEFKISSPLLTSGGKRVLMPSNIFEFGRPAMFAHANRMHAIYFEYPTREIDEVRIKLPDNLQIESLPADQETKLDYAVYKVSRTQTKNEIAITRDLAMATFVLNAKEYPSVKSFYDKVKEADGEQVLLKQVASVAQK